MNTTFSRLKNPLLAALGLTLALAHTAPAQNFTLTIQPSTLTLIPNQSASFVIYMAPFNGFNSNVVLSVETLPSGVTAQFSPSSLTPPGTAILTLSAATDAALGTFTLNAVAVGGGITNTTSSAVTVNFGLLPVGTGAVGGQVTDIETGQPVAGATVQASDYFVWGSATTDSNGMYLIAGLQLGSPNNQPKAYSFIASQGDYWRSELVSAYAVCDATNVVNLRMLRQQYGSITGHVLAQDGGALPGATVSLYGPTNLSVKADTNGLFQFPAVNLGYHNAPGDYDVRADYSGYWWTITNVTVAANSNSVVTLTLVPVCTNNMLYGRVTMCDSGLPLTNASVSVHAYNWVDTSTDSNGNFVATHLILNPDNAPVNVGVSVTYPGYYPTNAIATLSACGASNTVSACLQPIPAVVYNYGALTGHVFDIETGEPLANASVQNGGIGVGTQTDTNGAYNLTGILIGTGDTTNAWVAFAAEAPGYFTVVSNLILSANQVVTQDFRLLRIGYGYIAGTVRDAATGLPIAHASYPSGEYPSGWTITGFTDTNGHYASGPWQLRDGNVPTGVQFPVSATGYWTANTNITVTQGNTNLMDIDLVKVCAGATISGNVVDASTQKPIAYATVQNQMAGGIVTTDTNGHFIITNITVGYDNAPIQSLVTASAPGYISQSKTVTLFCGASITVEFGAPQTVFGAIEGYVTNTLTGSRLPNVFIGSGFGAATSTDTNGYYSFSQVPLGLEGASITWTVTAMPDGFPAQTKSVAVSSNQVSRLDFGFGQPPAALMVTASGAPNPVPAGSNLLYTVTLKNLGAAAANVRLVDSLPSSVIFLSSGITNMGGGGFTAPLFSNGVVTTTSTSFSSNAVAVLSVAVRSSVAGSLTNVATVTSDTPDVDATGSNRTAVVRTTVNGPAVTNVSVQVLGAVVFDRQTGLFDQSIEFNNLSGAPVTGIRIFVIGLPADVVLYNASGSTNGAPFVQYDQTVAAGGNVSFVLEYYRSDRLAFVSTNFSAVAVAAAAPSIPNSTPLQLDREPFMRSGALVIEFASTPGATYVVQYSADLQTWKTAVPPIVAAGTRVQWADAGPPKTDSPPGSPGQRFYRIVKLP